MTGARAKLKRLERSAWIFIANLDPNTSNDILEVFKELHNTADFEVNKLPCNKVNSNNSNDTFIIKALVKHEKPLRDPDFWPVTCQQVLFSQESHKSGRLQIEQKIFKRKVLR